MSKLSLWKAILALGYVQIVFGNPETTIEVTSSNACEICVCSPGPTLQPKEIVKCKNSKSLIKVFSLPNFVRGIEIINIEFGVVFMRGAIRVRNNFDVLVEKVKSVDFQEKSTTIIDSKGTVSFDIKQVKHIKIHSRAVSSTSGTFALQIENSEKVDIEGQAFDVINNVNLTHVKILNLAAAAFKPNVQLSETITKISLRHISSIPTLSMEVFSSAHSILFQHCHIDEIESSAFSGVLVNNITFDSSSVDRIHTSAFPDRALLQNLAFVNTSLTSVSEKAVASAITSLKMSRTNISSISVQAFSVASVAKVDINHCTFMTLVSKSFVFKSWNEVIFDSNLFMFLEEDAFMGITEPISGQDGTSSFYFTANRIQYANRNALKLDNMSKLVKNITKNNVFHRDCECDFDRWLMVVTGETDLVNPSDWTIVMLNSSLCQVPLFAKGCFPKAEVQLSKYDMKMCSMMATTQQDCSYESPWEIIRDQIEIKTNKGILLLILMFVLASTLVIGILTLLRWIVYTFQVRKFKRNDDWTFTKIEEQQKPLKENDVTEEEAIELQETPSPVYYESLAIPDNQVSLSDDSQTLAATKKEQQETSPIVNDEHEPLLEVKLPEHSSEGKPPTQTTFYDEMICLLQEKLQDPENYSSVVDDTSASTHNATLYMDPLNINKSS